MSEEEFEIFKRRMENIRKGYGILKQCLVVTPEEAAWLDFHERFLLDLEEQGILSRRVSV